jgi:hypothetical protein
MLHIYKRFFASSKAGNKIEWHVERVMEGIIYNLPRATELLVLWCCCTCKATTVVHCCLQLGYCSDLKFILIIIITRFHSEGQVCDLKFMGRLNLLSEVSLTQTGCLGCCSKLKFMGKADMSINITEMDESWEQKGGASFVMPDAVFNPHDFAVTDNYHVFFQVRPPTIQASHLMILPGTIRVWSVFLFREPGFTG